jgi:hypothetical protein
MRPFPGVPSADEDTCSECMHDACTMNAHRQQPATSFTSGRKCSHASDRSSCNLLSSCSLLPVTGHPRPACLPVFPTQGSGRRLLSGSGDGGGDAADRSSGGGSRKSGSGLTNPFAAASGSRPEDSGSRSASPLKESLSSSLGRFDPRQLWGGASASTSKDGGPSKAADQTGPSTTAGASASRAGAGSSGSTSAAAYASRRFLSSDDTSKATSEQPSAANGATALSSATAATPFSSATAAAPPPALGLLGQRSSSYSQRPGSASFGRSSSRQQEHISTLPSEEIDEVWATLDSEKVTRPGSSLGPSPEPPASRWGRSDSQTSSRAGTPAGGLSAGGVAGTGLPRSGSRGATGSRRLSSPASPPEPVWSPLSGTGMEGWVGVYGRFGLGF